jgi:hypothetical protein
MAAAVKSSGQRLQSNEPAANDKYAEGRGEQAVLHSGQMSNTITVRLPEDLAA